MDEINRIKERLTELDKFLNDKDYYISDDFLWETIQEKKWLEQQLEEAYTRVWMRDTAFDDEEYGVQLSEPDECEW